MLTCCENLALAGGGIWGIAYSGVFKEMQDLGTLPQLKRVAGTSAGSIVGLMAALGYRPDEILAILPEIDYTRFLDGGSVRNVPRRYGYYKGDYVLSLLRLFVKERLGDESATFADLQEAGRMDLRVFATNLNTRRIHEFSCRHTPHVALANAVRASMSIPLFFEAVQIDGNIFIDGGAVFDYPIMGFGDEGLDQTLGIAFARSLVTPAEQASDQEFDFNKPLQYFQRVVEALKTVQSPNFILNNKLRQQTILIDTGEINSFKFDVSQEEKDFLVQRGREAVRAYYRAEVVTGGEKDFPLRSK